MVVATPRHHRATSGPTPSPCKYGHVHIQGVDHRVSGWALSVERQVEVGALPARSPPRRPPPAAAPRRETAPVAPANTRRPPPRPDKSDRSGQSPRPAPAPRCARAFHTAASASPPASPAARSAGSRARRNRRQAASAETIGNGDSAIQFIQTEMPAQRRQRHAVVDPAACSQFDQGQKGARLRLASVGQVVADQAHGCRHARWSGPATPRREPRPRRSAADSRRPSPPPRCRRSDRYAP